MKRITTSLLSLGIAVLSPLAAMAAPQPLAMGHFVSGVHQTTGTATI